jgi:4-carboxymuconolactone decarboxylase
MSNAQQKSSAERSVRITDAAYKNHEELFPDHKSTLNVTDPELIELFDNFAFDEVITHSKLDTKTRVIVILDHRQPRRGRIQGDGGRCAQCGNYPN